MPILERTTGNASELQDNIVTRAVLQMFYVSIIHSAARLLFIIYIRVDIM
jgi:hypothetical protein